MPEVSVILPNYNHAPFLEQRIRSILNQTFQDFEIIILDDCSTDCSIQILGKYKNHPKVSHFIANEKNSGSPFKQWEKGIGLSRGEFIWIAESDDYSDPTFLESTCKYLQNNITFSLVYCDSYIVDKSNSVLNKMSYFKNNLYKTDRWSNDYISNSQIEVDKYLSLNCTINNSSAVLHRKKNLEKVFPLKNDFKYVGDWYIYLSTIYKKDLYYISSPLNYYREHNNHCTITSSNNIQFVYEYFIIYDLIYRKYKYKEFWPIIRKALKYTKHYGYFSNTASITKLYKKLISVNFILFLLIFFYNLGNNIIIFILLILRLK